LDEEVGLSSMEKNLRWLDFLALECLGVLDLGMREEKGVDEEP